MIFGTDIGAHCASCDEQICHYYTTPDARLVEVRCYTCGGRRWFYAATPPTAETQVSELRNRHHWASDEGCLFTVNPEVK